MGPKGGSILGLCFCSSDLNHEVFADRVESDVAALPGSSVKGQEGSAQCLLLHSQSSIPGFGRFLLR